MTRRSRTFSTLLLSLPLALACDSEAPGDDSGTPMTSTDAGTSDAGPSPSDSGAAPDGGAPDDASIDPPTKEEARETADTWERDLCAEYGWYEDEECDEFCPEADPACWTEDVRPARELVRAMNAMGEASCQLQGLMKNDENGTFYWGRLTMTDAPPARCEIVAEAGACFLRHCESLDATELTIDPDLEAGVGFTTNQSRWSSNPSWSASSANSFYMPPRGGDIEIGWNYDGANETVTVPAPSVVSALALRGEVVLDADLWVDLTYQRTAAEETATPSTTRVRLWASELPDAVECLVPDTVDEVRIDQSLLNAMGLGTGYDVRVEAGGYLMRFAEVGGCRAHAVVAKHPPGENHNVWVQAQVSE